jgi:RNA recognition motif-containing protein
MTLFVKDLPFDAREGELEDDIGQSSKVLRVMLMKKNDQCQAFVRFGSVQDAERAMGDIVDGATRVCGRRVSAEMARRNTEV